MSRQWERVSFLGQQLCFDVFKDHVIDFDNSTITDKGNHCIRQGHLNHGTQQKLLRLITTHANGKILAGFSCSEVS